MNDLAGWLLQQIAADEAVVARIDRPDDTEPSVLWPAMDDRAMGYNGSVWITPARLLAECAAKRRIVELHSGDAPWCGWTQGGDGTHGDMGVDPARPAPQDCATLRFLASVYADRPGYLDEWRVEAVAS